MRYFSGHHVTYNNMWQLTLSITCTEQKANIKTKIYLLVTYKTKSQ
jgi:hypothetical protein